MTDVRIADLLANTLVDPQAHLDPQRVAQYAALGSVAPVVVFETEDGLLLADGYHRVAAARLSGADTIDADVRAGSRKDALDYAVEHAARQRHITLEQALERVRKRVRGE
jgi:ParB-like chromosome segregation protein Spo0J